MVYIHQWNRNIAWRLVLVLYDPVFTRCSLRNEGATCKHQVQISFILLFCFLFFCQQPLLFCQAARLEGVMGGGDSQMSTFRETQREWHAHRKNTQDPKCYICKKTTWHSVLRQSPISDSLTDLSVVLKKTLEIKHWCSLQQGIQSYPKVGFGRHRSSATPDIVWPS